MLNDILKFFYYNVKIIISKQSLVFLLAALVIPTALNLSTAMYFEMIIPLCGTFIFSNILFYEKDHNISPVFNSTNMPKYHVFLIRILINSILFLFLSVIFYIYINFIIKNQNVDVFALTDNTSVVNMVFTLGLVNFLFFGLLSTTFANIFKSPIVGMMISIGYGLFWMAQYINLYFLIINPFSYSAGINNYLIYKLITCIFIIVMIAFNCYYTNSKFYRSLD